MKKKISILIVLFFLVSQIFAGMTFGQFQNREQSLISEWNSLCKMGKKLHNQSYKNLQSYMQGFAEAMYQCYEIGHSITGSNYAYKQYLFYYEQSRKCQEYAGTGWNYYYYNAGFNRVDKMSRQFLISDF